MKSKEVEVACAALMDPDDRILISQRGTEKYLGGLWEFPGGKLENNEHPKQALLREIKEELNITLCAECISKIDSTTYQYEDYSVKITLYLCRKWEGIPISNEGQILKWVTFQDLKQYLMPQANEALIEGLAEFI